MKLFINTHLKRIYLFAYIVLFITITINLILGRQIEKHCREADNAQNLQNYQHSLQSSIKHAANIFLDMVSTKGDNLEPYFVEATTTIYTSYKEVENNVERTSHSQQSLKKIKSLIDRSLQTMNTGIEEYKNDSSSEALTGHLLALTRFMTEMDTEISNLRDYKDIHTAHLNQKNQAAFKFSIPNLLIIFVVVSMLTGFSFIMSSKKEEGNLMKPSSPKAEKQPSDVYVQDERIKTIVHEIKNPLNNILMVCDLLEPGKPNDAVVAILRRNGHKINELVNDLLMSPWKSTGLDLREVYTKDLIEQAISQVEPKIDYQGIRLITHFHDDRCKILVDVEKMKIVLLNLILNAIEAMNKEVKILTIATRLKNGRCQIEISDNGMGISPAISKKIFDPHFTSKKKGSGLGLSNSRTLVRKLGGEIEFVSKPGYGTTFIIKLYNFK